MAAYNHNNLRIIRQSRIFGEDHTLDFGFQKQDMTLRNHEIWRKCPKCGAHNDLRMTDTCQDCKSPLK